MPPRNPAARSAAATPDKLSLILFTEKSIGCPPPETRGSSLSAASRHLVDGLEDFQSFVVDDLKDGIHDPHLLDATRGTAFQYQDAIIFACFAPLMRGGIQEFAVFRPGSTLQGRGAFICRARRSAKGRAAAGVQGRMPIEMPFEGDRRNPAHVASSPIAGAGASPADSAALSSLRAPSPLQGSPEDRATRDPS